MGIELLAPPPSFKQLSIISSKEISQPQTPEREFFNTQNLRLFPGGNTLPLGHRIGELLNVYVQTPPKPFADGEIRVHVPVEKDARVYIIQSGAGKRSPADNALELIHMVEAAAHQTEHVTAIVPYMPFSRQDRRDRRGATLGAKSLLDTLAFFGAEKIVVVDAHSQQPFDESIIPWVNLDSSKVLLPELQKIITNDMNVAIVAPDKGAKQRASVYAKKLGLEPPLAIKKVRPVDTNNISMALGIEGDNELTGEQIRYNGKDVFLFDDIIDTAGSICNAANFVMSRGAKSVNVVATHGLFSGDALQKISECNITRVIVTDSKDPTPEVKAHPKITIVTLAPLLAETIKRIENHVPLEDLALSQREHFIN